MANLLDNITGFANQDLVVQLPNGETFNLHLVYEATTERWIFDLAYQDFSVNGVGLCCFPNIIRQWKNILPFGLACVTDDQTDPFTVDDFTIGRARMYVLTAEEVSVIETSIFGALA